MKFKKLNNEWRLILSVVLIATASMLALQACGNNQLTLKQRSKNESNQEKPKDQEVRQGDQKGKNDQKAGSESIDHTTINELKKDEREITFKILEDQFVIKFLDIKLKTELEKTIVSSRIQFNEEKLSIVTEFNNYKRIDIGNLNLPKNSYTFSYQGKCATKECQKFYLSIMLLKDGEDGNVKSLRHFVFGYDFKTKKSLIVLNLPNEDENSFGTEELFNHLNTQLDKIN